MSFVNRIGAIQTGRRMIDDLGKSNYGFDNFQRMAGQGPGLDSFLGMSLARGGSFSQGASQFNQASKERTGQMYDAYGQFKIGADAQRASLINTVGGLEAQGVGMDMQRSEARAARRASFLNSIIGIGANIGGSMLGMSQMGKLFGGPTGAAAKAMGNPVAYNLGKPADAASKGFGGYAGAFTGMGFLPKQKFFNQ